MIMAVTDRDQTFDRDALCGLEAEVRPVLLVEWLYSCR